MTSRVASAAWLILCAGAAALTATGWWMLVDSIAPAQALRSPFPYLMLAAALFIGLPVWIAAHKWLGRSLFRALVVASVAISPAVAFAVSYFIYPRSAFAAFLLLSTAWMGTTVFWFAARRVRL